MHFMNVIARGLVILLGYCVVIYIKMLFILYH